MGTHGDLPHEGHELDAELLEAEHA
jgi:hypothetical protein